MPCCCIYTRLKFRGLFPSTSNLRAHVNLRARHLVFVDQFEPRSRFSLLRRVFVVVRPERGVVFLLLPRNDVNKNIPIPLQSNLTFQAAPQWSWATQVLLVIRASLCDDYLNIGDGYVGLLPVNGRICWGGHSGAVFRRMTAFFFSQKKIWTAGVPCGI